VPKRSSTSVGENPPKRKKLVTDQGESSSSGSSIGPASKMLSILYKIFNTSSQTICCAAVQMERMLYYVPFARPQGELLSVEVTHGKDSILEI
jgi:hypothetical protein